MPEKQLATMPKILIRLQQLKTFKIEITSKHPIKSQRPIPTPHGGSMLQHVADAIGAVIAGIDIRSAAIMITDIAFIDLSLAIRSVIYHHLFSFPNCRYCLAYMSHQIKNMFADYIQCRDPTNAVPEHTYQITCPLKKPHFSSLFLIVKIIKKYYNIYLNL